MEVDGELVGGWVDGGRQGSGDESRALVPLLDIGSELRLAFGVQVDIRAFSLRPVPVDSLQGNDSVELSSDILYIVQCVSYESSFQFTKPSNAAHQSDRG